jgi:ribosomal protein L7/L12
METMQCPSCGSPDIAQVGYPEYQCANCGTRFVPTQAPTGFVDVVLVSAPTGKNRNEIVMALRRLTSLDLSKAVWAVEHLPAVIMENIPVAEGERIKAELAKGGVTATLKPA